MKEHGFEPASALVAEGGARQNVGVAALRRLGVALEFIDTNLEGDLSLRRLAGVVHLSRFHFARAFKVATGKTLHAHVTERRLQRAWQLLSSGERTLCEVALMCGFSSQAHLCALFKKRFGVTPAQCRRMTSGSHLPAGHGPGANESEQEPESQEVSDEIE